mmetsp:Transcript_66218/g.107406  ORF Transcript_66218/g.107406 Transcript_66218/m.107406 type:complete len:172 (-) Transcript_66218:3299-3814(-)
MNIMHVMTHFPHSPAPPFRANTQSGVLFTYPTRTGDYDKIRPVFTPSLEADSRRIGDTHNTHNLRTITCHSLCLSLYDTQAVLTPSLEEAKPTLAESQHEYQLRTSLDTLPLEGGTFSCEQYGILSSCQKIRPHQEVCESMMPRVRVQRLSPRNLTGTIRRSGTGIRPCHN